MKFLNKVNDCVQHIILQKSTNFHAIQSWSFRNICYEIGWPVAPFFAPPCITTSAMLMHVIDIGWTSVCLSVCHTLVLYQNG